MSVPSPAPASAPAGATTSTSHEQHRIQQPLPPLPPFTTHITTHSPHTPHHPTLYSSTSSHSSHSSHSSSHSSSYSLGAALQPWDPTTTDPAAPTFLYAIPHSTPSLPVQMSGDADLHAHSALLATGFRDVVLRSSSGGGGSGGGNGGVNLRVLELPPGYESVLHRTISVDYGVLVEGEVELILWDGVGGQGEGNSKEGMTRTTTRMKRGDLVVQRATMHAWRNPSEKEWARLVFVVLEGERLVVGGEELKEQWGLEG